jgi:hypothetical protein
MTTWMSDELSTIGGADELELAPRRGGACCARPSRSGLCATATTCTCAPGAGAAAPGSARNQARHEGRIRAGGVEKDVTFVEETDPGIIDALHAAYRTKYRRSASYVPPMFAPGARATTVKLVPRGSRPF